MEYSFIAIAPRFTLTQSDSIWLGPIYGSNRTNCVCKQMTDVKLLRLCSNIKTILLCAKKSSVLFKNVINKCVYKSYIYLMNMHEQDLALNNLG